MSAKQSEPLINVNIRIPVKMKEEIEAAAAVADTDQSEIARRALSVGMAIMRTKGFNLVDVYLGHPQATDSADAPQRKPLKEVPKKDPIPTSQAI